ncbi:hypothetical protein MSIMFI_01829 [Mycobacterium simulans]|uniref:TfuA-like protein n=1 Tax=Mycobacterium simulans TaxID=627089 RepID=UPI00174B0B2A|nr:TfuA-like protein [Mycobacterium simulans]SON60335.1 hypothetical protein MSIMFI_01829 [Mycobacterium simulans]
MRAAEQHLFGMEGYGWIFEHDRDGVLVADDEVAMVHGDREDVPQSQSVAGRLRSLPVDVKRSDAVIALHEVIRGHRGGGARRAEPPPTIWSERFRPALAIVPTGIHPN